MKNVSLKKLKKNPKSYLDSLELSAVEEQKQEDSVAPGIKKFESEDEDDEEENSNESKEEDLFQIEQHQNN